MIVPLLAVDVHARLIPRRLNGLAEGHGAVGQVGVVVAVGAGILGADRLPVKIHRQLQLTAFEPFQHILSLLPALLRRQRLREEVHARVDTGGVGAVQMAVKQVVRLQGALAVAPEAQTDDGKLYAALRRFGPVHVFLEHRQVDAPPDGKFAAYIPGLPLQRDELPAVQRADGKVLVGRQPHHIGPVVDVDLPRVGIRFLPLSRRQQRAEHQQCQRRHDHSQYHRQHHRQEISFPFSSGHRLHVIPWPASATAPAGQRYGCAGPSRHP